MSAENWIMVGLVAIILLIDIIIGRNTIKKCEAEMVRALKHAERMKNYALDTLNEAWVFKMAQVDEKVQLYEEEILMKVHEKLRLQNEEVIQELRKETAGMKEWVIERENKYEAEVGNFKTEVRQAAEILSEFITHELYLKPETKPAEVKLTLDFKRIKK